ncbi:MAG: hypothetical protein RIC29_12100 [Rhodospirillaceae bacterium]
MKPEDYISALCIALTKAHGIIIDVPDAKTLRRVRRRLYQARDRARKESDTSFDDLSFIERNSFELWVVKRSALPRRIQHDDLSFGHRDIDPGDVPTRPNVRGPNKEPRNPLDFI